MRLSRTPCLVALTWPVVLGLSLTMLAFAALGWLAPADVRALSAPAAAQIPPPAAAFTRTQPAQPPFVSTGGGSAGALAPANNSPAPFLTAGEDMPLSPPLAGLADLAVCMDTDRAWGVVDSGDTVTVTVKGAQMGASMADGIGFFWTPLYQGSGARAGLAGSNEVRFYQEGVQIAAITLRNIDAVVDPLADSVSGAIGNVSAPISVTVYAPADRPLAVTNRIDTTTNSSGDFSADFSSLVDLWADAPAVVAYIEGGVEVQRQFHARRLRVLPWPINYVTGYAEPSMAVTMTLLNADLIQKQQMTTAADARTGGYGFDVLTDVLPGEIVMVGWDDGAVLSRSVVTFTLETDAQNDRLTGMTLPALSIHGRVDNLTADGRRLVQRNTDASFTGAYTISFSGQADIMGPQWAGARIVEADGDELDLWDPAAYVEVDQTWNSVSGSGATAYGSASTGKVVTLTLTSTDKGATDVYTTTTNHSSWYQFNQDSHGLPDIVPGDVLTVTQAGSDWQGVVFVQAMTLAAEPDIDHISGSVVSPTQRVELSAWHWNDYPSLFPAGGSVEKLITATSPFSADLDDLDVHNGVGFWAAHRVPDDYSEGVYGEVNWLEVSPRGNGGEAVLAPAGSAYTFTLLANAGESKATLTGESNGPIWATPGGVTSGTKKILG